jgi:hypothetical protein
MTYYVDKSMFLFVYSPVAYVAKKNFVRLGTFGQFNYEF